MNEKRDISPIVIYQTEDGNTKIEVRLEDETVWLSQKLMAELFQKDVRTINEHIRNIFEERELSQDSVIRNFRITAADGKMYETLHYNLDVIISVGYRVRSHRGTQFRIWATQRLKEYIIKGFVLDDERLKNPHQPFDYYEELLRRIQDIRTSERRFYQKIIDIYATSVDTPFWVIAVPEAFCALPFGDLRQVNDALSAEVFPCLCTKSSLISFPQVE